MSVDTSTRGAVNTLQMEPQQARAAGARTTAHKIWSALWPKLLAIAIVIVVWQLVYWSGWKPPYALPSPSEVGQELVEMAKGERLWQAIGTTMRRALMGFTLALVIGTFVGLAVTKVLVLRRAVGSIITGLQTMPSIVWFPLAILMFGLNEQAILFVVILGAAPSIANGVIAGVDHVPPAFVKLGTVLGAKGVSMYRFIIMPAALPSFVSGLSQGWAFSWRSLMAGELLVVIPGVHAVGTDLDFARQLSQASKVVAGMIVILILGMLVDAVFSKMSREVRRRRGLAVD